jgi:hypothetical protein
MKNYQIILTSIISFWVGISILNGTIPQRYFAGELNELGCAVIALTMGTLSLFGIDWKGLINWLLK